MRLSPAAYCLLLLCLLMPAAPTRAVDFDPLATRNQSPLVRVYGLPTAPPARLLENGRLSATLSLDLASNFVQAASTNEELLLDGESSVTSLGLRYGLGRNLEFSVDLPYVSHDGGFLDGFIEGWHDTFGLPQGDRPQAPEGRLDYHYNRNGATLLSLAEPASGWGDLRLNAAWQLVREGGSKPGYGSLQLSLKLPTGDSDKLLGSGSTDLALSIAGQRQWPTAYGPTFVYAALGGMLMSQGDILPDQQRSSAWFGSFALGWAPWNWMALKLQADGHTAFYDDSQLDELTRDSIQLAMGGTLLFSEGTSLDLAVSEDIIVDTAPDVSFHIALRHVF